MEVKFVYMNTKEIKNTINDLTESIDRISKLTGVDAIESQPIVDKLKKTLETVEKMETELSPKPPKEKTIINLTPHDVDVIRQDGTIKVFHPSGKVARVFTREQTVDVAMDVRIMTYIYGEVDGLPDYVPNVYYIVSSQIANAVPNRTDLLVPGKRLVDNQSQSIGRKWLFSPNTRVIL